MKYIFPLKNKSKFDTRKFTRKLSAIIRQKTYGQKTLKKIELDRSLETLL